MKTLARQLFNRPWQCLLLLLVGLPFAWAAGVSINNMVITTVKQLSFAQARAELMVGGQFTQAATVRLSPGAVSYRSSHPQVAPVNAQTGQVSGLQPGEATVFADQAAAAPYPSASASYTVRVIGQTVVFNNWQLPSVKADAPAFQIAAPTSNNPAGPISYSLKDGDSPVLSITGAGLVTVKGVGKATIVATQAASGPFESGSTQAVLEVTPSSTSFTWPAQTAQLGSPLSLQNPTDSPNTVGLFSYTVKPDAQNRVIATVAGNVLTPLTTGSTTITVTQAAGGNYAAASLDVALTVVPGSFTISGFTVSSPRTFDAVQASGNVFQLPLLSKPAGSQSDYVFTSDPAGIVSIAGRTVTVLKPGSVTLTATLARDPAVHEAATASAALEILKAVPQISLSRVDKTTGDAPFAIAVSSSNSETPITLSLEGAPHIATLSAGANGQWTASIHAAGSATLVAKQAASASGVFADTSVSVPFVVTDAALLKPNTLALANVELLSSDTTPFKPAWTGAIGDPASIEVLSSNPAVATVSPIDRQTLTITGLVGSTNITLKQPAQAGFRQAEVTATLTVKLGPYAITGLNNLTRTFDAVNPAANQFDLPPLDKPQGSASTYSFSSSNTAVATISGRTVTVLKPGTSTITATLPADPLRHRLATASLTLTVNKAIPVLTVTDAKGIVPPAGAPFNDVPFSVSTNSDGRVIVELQNQVPRDVGLSFINPATQQRYVRIYQAGTGTIDVITLETDTFAAGHATAYFLATNQAATANTLGLANIDKLSSDAPFKPAWTNAIGNPATIEVSSDNAAVATVGADKQTISLTGQVGTAQIRLRQPPQGGYEFANVTATLTVRAGSFPITGLSPITRSFDAVNLAANQFDLPTLAKPPGSAASFGFSSSDTAVATISGQRVTILKPGSITITATLPEDPLHHLAASASTTLTVNKATPSITLAPVEKLAGDPRFAIPVGSTNRDTPITLELLNPQPPGFATLVLDANQEWIATVQGIGTASLVARQAASASGVFAEASTSVPFNVRTTALLPNTLALAAFDKLVTDAPFKPSWQGAVGDPGTIVVSSANADVASVNPADKQTITLTGRAGSTEITLTQDVQNGFQPAVVKALLTVRPVAFQITGLNDITRTFDALTPAANQFDLPTLTKPQGSASSFGFSSSDPSVATITGQRVTVLKPGTASITASLPEDPQRHAAASATVTLTVNKALPAIGLADVNKALGDPDFKINLTSNSPQPIELALQNAQPPGFATLSRNASQEWVAHIVGVGSATLVATQGPSASGVFDSASASAAFTVTASALLPNPLSLAAFDKLSTDAAFKPAWTNALGDIAAIEVSLDNSSVATVDPANKQTITLTGQAGSAEITLRQAASATHQAAEVKALMTVRTGAAQAATLAFSPASFTKTYGDSPFTPSLLNTTDALPTFTSSNTQVASVDSSGRVISILGAGTADITATVASPNFATTTAVARLTVNKRAANLAVNGSLLRAFASGPFDLPLSTLSSGALSVSSSNTAVATVAVTPGSRPRVTPVGLGDTLLTIAQAEDANHLAAQIQPDAKLSISGPQASITWKLPAEIVYNAAATTVRLPAATTSNASSPIGYSASGSPAVGSLSNLLDLTLNGTLGTITLTAAQPAGNGYAATQISTQVKVVAAASGTKANTALSAAASLERNLADGAFSIPYQTDSDAPVVITLLTGGTTLSLDSSDPTGQRLIPRGAGEALVQLSQAATATRNAATPVRVNVLIRDGDPIYAFAPIELNYNIDSSVVDIAPPQSRSVGEFTYTVVEGKDIVKLVGNRQLQMLAAGEATLLAVQKANGAYASDEATTRVTVRAQTNNLAFNTSAMSLDTQGRVHRVLSGPPSFSATASSRSPAPISYSSSRPSVASIDAASGVVTVHGLGETTLMASQPQAWTGFTAAQAQLVLRVDDSSSLSLAPFEVPLSQLTVVPPYTTTAPDRAVELSVDKPALASLSADRRSLNLLGEGTVQVTVTHPATTTQAAVSATALMSITARVPTISVQPASIQHIWTGAEQKTVLNPSSDNTAGGWQLTSNNPAVATVSGLEVTLRGVGSTSLLLVKPAGAGWAQGSLSIPVQVVAGVTELNDMSRAYGTPNIELPSLLNGQNASYTSLTPAVAEIVNGRSVKLNSVGSTRLQARTAAGALIKEVTLTVTPGDPLLVMNNVSLASTAFGTTMKASSNSIGKITYSLASGSNAEWPPEVQPNGELLVTGPGTVLVQALQEAQGNYASAMTTASVSIADGEPAMLIVQGPPPVVKRGDSFEVRYRINFAPGNSVGGGVFSDSEFGYVSDSNVVRLSDTPPSKIGEEGRMVFRVKDNAELRTYRFAMAGVYSYSFDRDLSGRFNNPNFYRDFSVQGGAAGRFNLGPPLTMVVGTTPVMPKTYSANGVEITSNSRCTVFMSSNPGVLAGVGLPFGSYAYPADKWKITGSGTTTVDCAEGGYEGVQVTVVGADPLLQGFPSIDIAMDSEPYPLRAPASLNSSGTWRYEIVQLPGEPVVARIVNGEVYPLQAGRALVRATQAANQLYREASIETELRVSPAAARSFATMIATYGDPDFAAPSPDGVAAGTPIAYSIVPPSVATVADGKVHIQGAGTATVTATWREGSADRTAQGELIVLKAKPRLFFHLPPQIIGITACGTIWTWPIANQGSNNSVGGTLITNSDGALWYPMGSIPFRGGDNGPNPDGQYWSRYMSTGTYVKPTEPNMPAWVEQAESANFLAARSEILYYGLWADSNVVWNEERQAWFKSCNQ